MTELKFTRDGWFDGDVGDADECATFTRLKITAGNAIITRNFSKRGGGETEALNLPLFPLAGYIAKLWCAGPRTLTSRGVNEFVNNCGRT